MKEFVQKYLKEGFFGTDLLKDNLDHFTKTEKEIRDFEESVKQKEKLNKRINITLMILISIVGFSAIPYNIPFLFGIALVLFIIVACKKTYNSEVHRDQLRLCKPLSFTNFLCERILESVAKNDNVMSYVKIVVQNRQLYMYDYNMTHMIECVDRYEQEELRMKEACQKLHSL